PLRAAVAFTGATLLTRDHGKRTVTVTVAATGDVQPSARTLAAMEGIEPLRCQDDRVPLPIRSPGACPRRLHRVPPSVQSDQFRRVDRSGHAASGAVVEPWSYELAGRVEEHAFASEVLKENALGDPHVRPLWVYLPPGYDDDPERRFPSVYVIQGLTGQLDMWRNRTALRRTFPELVDETFALGESPSCVLVYVDAWTSLGGSQFIDSPGTGRYHTYIVDELVPFVDSQYRTMPEAAHRGIAGWSSGGYGAMVNPMLRPDVFGGLATPARDALFEVCYLPDMRRSVRALRDHYEGSFDKFWEDFHSRPAFSKDQDFHLLNDWCMAACYSADEDGTVQLPYDTETGELRPDVWE